MGSAALDPMFTIFEGPDCSGKSTLVKAFHERLGYRSVHHGPYLRMQKRLPQMYVETMQPMLLGHEGQIWDRCWLSEPIYGQAFRGGTDRVGFVARRHLERIAFRHGAVVILCLPPFEVVKEKWIERIGEEYLDKVEQLQLVYEGYERLRRNTHLPVVMYDYTRHSEEELWSRIATVRPRRHLSNHSNSVGNYNARICLVGDQVSDWTDESTRLLFPFSSFAKIGSSSWLTQQLEKAKIREDDLFWLNANDEGANVPALRGRNFELIIALGQEASKRLEVHNISHVTVPHPQHQKRFNHAAPYELIHLLTKHLGV